MFTNRPLKNEYSAMFCECDKCKKYRLNEYGPYFGKSFTHKGLFATNRYDDDYNNKRYLQTSFFRAQRDKDKLNRTYKTKP